MATEQRLAGNGPPRLDSMSRTVSIPVRIQDGVIASLDHSPLPAIADCIADLVVPAYAITDPVVLARLTEESVDLLFKAGTRLLCRVSGPKVPEALLDRIKRTRLPHSEEVGAFVEVVLDEDQEIRYRGNKKAFLERARCHVPALDKLAAESLNEAYRKISEKFEPTRRSFGGNVFLNIYRYVDEKKEWRPIGELRGDLIYLPR